MIRHHVRSFGANKIMAIKLVRELTQLGLKEAKDLVESYGSFMVAADAQTVARAAEEARRYDVVFDPPLDPLTPTLAGYETLAARGGYSIRYISGPQKIASIKLVRELTGLGLKEAKDLVDEGGVFRTELTEHEVQDVVRRFLEIDARVEVLGRNESPAKPAARQVHDFEKEDDYDF